jgi:hypothetical protein
MRCFFLLFIFEILAAKAVKIKNTFIGKVGRRREISEKKVFDFLQIAWKLY